jgi:hypothetical protein
MLASFFQSLKLRNLIGTVSLKGCALLVKVL